MIAAVNFGKCLTKGKDYPLIREVDDNYVIIDDEGFELGFHKDNFEVDVVCGEVFAIGNPFTWNLPTQESITKYQRLFNFFSEEHGLTLLESQMDDIINEVQIFLKEYEGN